MAVAVLAAALLGSGTAAAADGDGLQLAGPQDAIAWFSDSGDLLNQGHAGAFLWRGTDSTIKLEHAGDGVAVSIGTDGTNDFHHFELQPPPGTALRPGAYPDASEVGYQRPGEPGLEVKANDQSCGGTSEFEVRDIAWDAGGQPTRLWAVFAQSCGGSGLAAHWGEIRLGEPETAAPIVVPSVVRWPEADLGAGHSTVPATVIAGTQGTTVENTSLSGAQASDYAISTDDCAGRTLAPNATCPVQVGFVPAVSGTRQATLGIGTSAGTLTAALQGWTYGGTTRLHITGDPDDWITQGGTYDLTPANARFAVMDNDARGLRIGVGTPAGDWTVTVGAARNATLVAPMTYDATTDDTGPVLDVTAPGRGCGAGGEGTFTMDELRYRPAQPLAAGVGLSFTQNCQGEAAAAHGTLEFRAGDTTTPAPWMAAAAVPGAVGGGSDADGSGGGAPAGGAALSGAGAPAAPVVPVRARKAAPLLKFLGLVGKGARTLRFSSRLPRAGTLTARVTVKLHGRTLRLGDGRVTTTRAATKTMNIGLRKAVLKALAHVHSAPLTATVTWRPKGAKAIRSQATGVLRLRR